MSDQQFWKLGMKHCDLFALDGLIHASQQMTSYHLIDVRIEACFAQIGRHTKIEKIREMWRQMYDEDELHSKRVKLSV